MALHLQPALSEEPPQADRVDPRAQVERIAADARHARSQVVPAHHAAALQAPGQQVVALQPWRDEMHGARSRDLQESRGFTAPPASALEQCSESEQPSSLSAAPR